MKTIGIIAEYNPFHNGHAYQIKKAKEISGADNVVVIMSGDFVQRGAPACIPKMIRTKLALQNGADMVFQLPVCYSTGDANVFASGAISILSQLGFVDGVCFGSESGELTPFIQIGNYLAKKEDELNEEATQLCRTGITYPAARECILEKVFPEIPEDFWNKPNNILGLEYIKAIKKQNSSLTPYTIKRVGADYHSNEANLGFMSASGIREALNDPKADSLVYSHLPSMTDEEKQWFHMAIAWDDLSQMMYITLLNLEENNSILDLSTTLYHRIQQTMEQWFSSDELVALLNTKQYTKSRIQRTLCHILLGIEKSYVYKPHRETDNSFQIRNPLPPSYVRLLGFKKEKSSLLRETEDITIITKLADGYRQLQNDPIACKQLEKDILAAHIYRNIFFQKHNKKLPTEFQQNIIHI